MARAEVWASSSAAETLELAQTAPRMSGRRARLTAEDDFYYKIAITMAREHLGRFEHLLLLAVVRLGDDAYGMTIRRELARHTGREISVGAIYTSLARLEAKGLVQSRLGDPTPERGGKAKRFYRVLPAGKKAIALAQAILLGLARGIEQP